ncbi:MAG: radical SAM protein, partial [Oscillospiraceae bacterium]|nr:radical SAM protein [Oscillospiraceae bacterium]
MRPKKRILPVFVPHLGCPHACVFCNQHRISGAAKPVTASDVDAAVRKAGEETPGLTIEVAFYGGSFTAIDPGEQKALLSALA